MKKKISKNCCNEQTEMFNKLRLNNNLNGRISYI